MTFNGPIGDLIKFSIGGGWGSDQPKNGFSEVAVIRGTDIPKVTMGDFSTVPRRFESKTKLANRLLEVGDLVLETAGGSSANGQFTGRTLLVTEEILSSLGPTICASFCKRLALDSSSVEPEYFYWYMQDLYSSGRVAIYDSQSTGISNFQFANFLDAEILILPKPATQRVIAQSLSKLNELIVLNRQITKSLEETAQTIFRSWFIDFDPVKAKMAGEKPVGMDDATAALFPDSMVDSELGPIPKGWHVGSMAEFFALQGGYSFKSSSWQETGVPVIKIGSVKPGIVDLNQVSYIDETLATSTSDVYRLPRGSLVIGLTGYVGEVGLIMQHQPIPLLNQRVAKFLPISGRWKIPFVYCLTRRTEFKQSVVNSATGSAQQNVSNSQILGLATCVPTAKLIEVFNSQFESFFNQILGLSEQNTILSEIRDALLPRLISGELQIPEEMLGV
jgi:type I restriction enzyme S subunit